MQRDMDVIRQILLKIEESPHPTVEGYLEIPDLDKGSLLYHQHLLMDAGYINAFEARDANTRYGFELQEASLTWEGHEFLEKIRDPEIWRKTKNGASKVGSFAITFVAELATSYAKQKAQELGILA